MRLIAIADTHIQEGPIKKQLPDDLMVLLKEADLIIHAGDFVAKSVFDELSTICRIEAVHGNTDDDELKELLPEQKVIEIEGIKIGIVHQAALSIHDITGAWYMAKEMGVDVLIFGHTHRPLIERSDVLLICPGSPTTPRLSEPGAVELLIEDGRISGRIITLRGTACSAIENARSFHLHS